MIPCYQNAELRLVKEPTTLQAGDILEVVGRNIMLRRKRRRIVLVYDAVADEERMTRKKRFIPLGKKPQFPTERKRPSEIALESVMVLLSAAYGLDIAVQGHKYIFVERQKPAPTAE